MPNLSFRVMDSRKVDYFRVIVFEGRRIGPGLVVDGPATAWVVHCNCEARQYTGHEYCRHIEAPLVAGERAMVHQDDLGAADEVMALLGAYVKAPPSWKGSWRKDMRWRGFTHSEPRTGGRKAPIYHRFDGRPVVCFTGAMDRPRKQMAADADAAGWDVIDNPHSRITALVAADPTGTSGKLVFARQRGIPILSLEEWAMVKDTAPPI